MVTARMECSYYAFVLHSDGTFKVWDIMNHNRRLSHKLRTPSFTGHVHFLFVIASILHDSISYFLGLKELLLDGKFWLNFTQFYFDDFCFLGNGFGCLKII